MFRHKFRLLFFLGMGVVLLAVIGAGISGRGELRPEIRLKLYDQAIRHYEKAKALHEGGRPKEALRELGKATKTVSAFPEAYDLANKIHLELGNPKEAEEQEALFRQHGGDRGASLFGLRERIAEEIIVREKLAPPPDIDPLPSVLGASALAALFFFAMIYEYRRLTRRPDQHPETQRIFLDRFPSEEPEVIEPTGFFKLCALLLPAPCLFLLLIFFGLRHWANLLPILLFSGIIIDVAIYLIFFADLSDLGGLRRPGGGA